MGVTTSRTAQLTRKLYKEAKEYSKYENRYKPELRQCLVETLQHIDNNNDNDKCREIFAHAVDNDDLGNAFVVASERHHLDLLELFVNNGININIVGFHDQRALETAGLHIETIRFLLDHQANINAQNVNGDTVLMAICRVPDLMTKEEYAWGNSTSSAKLVVVRLLLDYNIDINITNNQGKTIMDIAKKDVIDMISNHVNYSNNNYFLK